MISLRISSKTEAELNEYCEKMGLSKSQVVKEALAQYLLQKQNALDPYEAGKDLFGQEGSGEKDNSRNYKAKVKSKIDEKHSD